MAVTYNADEILEIAERIERNGARFYRRAAESIKEAKAHHLLLTLAAMEDEHMETFAEMRAEAAQSAEDAAGTSDFDLDNQAGMYLRAVADGQVFDVKAQPAEHLTGDEPAEDILRMALALEKESVVFYEGIRQAAPERLSKNRIDQIISEEMRHIADLSRELAALGAEAK